jgi:RimJ/RimL family protein N-acetyltransferase
MAIALRSLELSDAPDLHRMFNEPELVGRRYIDKDRGPISQEQVEDLLGMWVKPEDGLRWGVTDGEDLVGIAVHDTSWEPLAPFVAVVIDPSRQRRGHGTEALTLLLGQVFSTTPALAAQTWVDEWNGPGLAFAVASGLQEAGRARREGIRDGKYYASVAFDYLREEWEARVGN